MQQNLQHMLFLILFSVLTRMMREPIMSPLNEVLDWLSALPCLWSSVSFDSDYCESSFYVSDSSYPCEPPLECELLNSSDT